MSVEFKEWPKIPRGSAFNVSITEKIDGTNGCVIIEGGEVVGAQSRNKLIYPEGTEGQEKGCDNSGFASWVRDNKEDLKSLGDGYHYGEWAGPAIQKNPHNLEEKTFFLFNNERWAENPSTPACCSVVPLLYNGEADKDTIQKVMNELFTSARDNHYEPEGVVAYWRSFRKCTKHTFKSQEGKWRDL